MATNSTADDRRTADAVTLAEQAEAEAAQAEEEARQAEAAAEAARTQAAEVEAESIESPSSTESAASAAGKPLWTILGLAAAAVVLCALLAASGYLFWSTQQAAQQRDRDEQFAAAARQGVVNLLSLDFNKGDADIQRLIDSTTGEFRSDFEKSKGDFLSVMKDSKVTTQGEVKATAVDSSSADSAVVLIAAASHVSNQASAQQPPRNWRLAVTLQRDGGQLKMSKVEFVP